MPNVYANGLEISGQAVQAQTIAAFPDVCFTPPESPATPPGVPIPYPSFGMASDTEKGTGTVFIGDKTVNIKNKSDLKRTSGTEAGCAAKKGVITSKNTGKEYFHKWSNNVKFDGEPVIRFSDLATNNHMSPAGNTPPWLHTTGANPPPPPPDPPEECPCCGAIPPHANQVDADGNLLPTISEAEYYERGYNARRPNLQGAVDDMQAAIDRLQDQLNNVRTRAPHVAPRIEANIGLSENALQQRQEALDEFDNNYNRLTNARDEDPVCPNLHDPADEGCGTHFDRTGAPPMPEPRDLGYTEQFGQDFKREWDRVHGTDVSTRGGGHENRNNHMTPLNAGGCPTGSGNIIPHQALSPDCQALDDIQSSLQG